MSALRPKAEILAANLTRSTTVGIERCQKEFVPLLCGMRGTLRLHPDSSCFAVTQIEVEATRPQARSLVLAYVVIGKIDDLAIPPMAAATRTDELWRHTCFEAFVHSSLGRAYYEFNLAPSTQWAAYWFNSYRSGMRVATEVSAPRIAVETSSERCIVKASLELDRALACFKTGGGGGKDPVYRLGLSAVIEERSGRRSYWALAHPPGKADFHHSDCFALEIS
jgi:hypothetical protein